MNPDDASMQSALLDAAQRSLSNSERTYQDVLRLAEVADALDSAALAGTLLGAIDARLRSEDGVNGTLCPEEVAALAKSYRLLQRLQPDPGPHL